MIETKDRNSLEPAEHIVLSSNYSGSERRREERRTKSDRRGVHRADGKVSRRSGKGRRRGERVGLFLRDVAKK